MTVEVEADRQQYRQEVTAHPAAVAGVRRIVGVHLRLWGFEQLVDDAALCVSELLSNVDKHADGPACVLTLQRKPTGVRVVVSDTNFALPVLRQPDWAAEDGRGLTVLAGLTTDWGAEPTAEGKDVWFEMHVSSRDARPAAGVETAEVPRPICGERACLSPRLIRAALELAPRSAVPGDVEIHLRCTLEDHATGDHHAFVAELDGPRTGHASSVWTTWTRGHHPVAIAVLPDCDALSPAVREACCEFAAHPGVHTWQLRDPWRTPDGAAWSPDASAHVGAELSQNAERTRTRTPDVADRR